MNKKSVKELRGVGEQIAKHLARLHIDTIQDLIFHLPIRYEDRTRIHEIGKLELGEKVLVEGVVQFAQKSNQRRSQLICRIQDSSGSLTLRFFHFAYSQYLNLSRPETRLRCFGEVRRGYEGGLEMIHPEYRQVKEGAKDFLSDYLTPVYSITRGLHQGTLRNLMEQAILLIKENNWLPELLPEKLLKEFNLMSLEEALRFVHFPQPDMLTKECHSIEHPARLRLAFEELLAHHLAFQQARLAIREKPALPLKSSSSMCQSVEQSLSFSLTGAQKRVIEEISADLQKPYPMLRLVQGDVGSGKTIVAAMAILRAIESGYQAAVMAPTELLAEQHAKNFTQWLEPLDLSVGYLSGGLSIEQRRDTLDKICAGDYQLVVGTHALFQDTVNFSNLALLVVDEQHRFGVMQRIALKEKGSAGCCPHQLIMSATPIPRTLSMVAYADLDCSVIDELPPGRLAIKTVLIPSRRRKEVIERVRDYCSQGRQAYWVCTLVVDSEKTEAQAAEDIFIALKKSLPNLKIGLVHGRMKPSEKESVMAAFKAGDINLLVGTTVIEVGVDVTNASLMVIENPERLGLSQLHQLRGRVGRGSQASYCVLLYQSPLTAIAEQRLKVMRQTQDGFAIARYDLEMRGPGEVLGTRQAGLLRMRVADLLQDKALLPHVHKAGSQLIASNFSETDQLIARWLCDKGHTVEV